MFYAVCLLYRWPYLQVVVHSEHGHVEEGTVEVGKESLSSLVNSFEKLLHLDFQHSRVTPQTDANEVKKLNNAFTCEYIWPTGWRVSQVCCRQTRHISGSNIQPSTGTPSNICISCGAVTETQKANWRFVKPDINIIAYHLMLGAIKFSTMQGLSVSRKKWFLAWQRYCWCCVGLLLDGCLIKGIRTNRHE